MCGISGCVSRQHDENTIEQTLKIMMRQLNRGVGGTGLAWIRDGEIKFKKSPTHPYDFARKMSPLNTSNVSFAHNRWPTCGNINYFNTHPFLSCRDSPRKFIYAHNGIEPNILGFKDELKKTGHYLKGDTDSEILCHIICDYLKSGYSLSKAIKTFHELFPMSSNVLLTRDSLWLWGDEIVIFEEGRDGGSIYFASEGNSIKSVVRKNGKWYQPDPIMRILLSNGRMNGVEEIKYPTESRFYIIRKNLNKIVFGRRSR